MIETYTTVISGKVQYTFLTSEPEIEDKTLALYSISNNELSIYGSNWKDDSYDNETAYMWGQYDEEEELADLGRHQI